MFREMHWLFSRPWIFEVRQFWLGLLRKEVRQGIAQIAQEVQKYFETAPRFVPFGRSSNPAHI
jgi:hypothetical protein